MPWVAAPAALAPAPPNANPDPVLAVLLAPNPVFVAAAPNGLLAPVVLPPNGLFCAVVLFAPNPPPVLEEPNSPLPLVAAGVLPKPPVAGLF